MIIISEEKINSFIERVKAIIDSDDIEIKDCALIALAEELEELKTEGINE